MKRTSRIATAAQIPDEGLEAFEKLMPSMRRDFVQWRGRQMTDDEEALVQLTMLAMLAVLKATTHRMLGVPFVTQKEGDS